MMKRVLQVSPGLWRAGGGVERCWWVTAPGAPVSTQLQAAAESILIVMQVASVLCGPGGGEGGGARASQANC
jgi:hypothetical protein